MVNASSSSICFTCPSYVTCTIFDNGNKRMPTRCPLLPCGGSLSPPSLYVVQLRATGRLVPALAARGFASSSGAHAASIFSPTPEHSAFRSMLRSFAETEVEPQALKHHREERFNLPLFRKLGDLGVLGITAPVQHGGSGMDVRVTTAQLRGMGRGDAVCAWGRGRARARLRLHAMSCAATGSPSPPGPLWGQHPRPLWLSLPLPLSPPWVDPDADAQFVCDGIPPVLATQASAVVIAHEELAAADPAFTLSFLAHSMLFVNNLAFNGNEEQCARLLPSVCSGTKIGGS